MSRSKYLQRVVHLTFAAAALSVAVPALSADTDLPEVVVTAQKRSETLTEIPVAISAFTSEQRDQIGITSVVDMANFTPGFVYNQGQDRVSMRGIGRYTNQLGADSSVGVYEDGAFETFTVKAGNSSLYTDRIEILRGPQGTLYGRNSIGGAVNIISRRPTREWYSEVRLSEDNYNNHIEEGAVSGPITDNVQFRLVATKYDQTKGYFDNVGGGPSSGNVRDEWAYEGQIAWQITDATDLWVKLFGGQWNNGGGNAGGKTTNQVVTGTDGMTPSASGIYPQNGPGNTLTSLALVPSLGIGFTVPLAQRTGPNTTGVNPGNHDLHEFYSTYDQYVKLRDYYGVILQLNHHFEGADLKYIGAAQHYNYFEGVDWGEGYVLSTGLTSFRTTPTGTPIFPGSILIYGEKHSLNTNEVNLISNGSGAVQYVVGIYNFNEFYMQPEEVALPGQSQLAAPLTLAFTPAAPNPLRSVFYGEGDAGARTWAGYGQIDWTIADVWKATFGLRYSKDWKWGFDRSRLLTYNAAAGVGLDISGAFLPAASIAGSPVGTPPRGATLAWLDPATGVYSRRLEADWSGVTGTAGFEWNPDKQTNLYFKYSRGFKSGGFNNGSGLVASPETDPEHSNDFQFGYKQNFDNKFQLNVDVFYDQYYNAQIPIGVLQPSGLVAGVFYNMPEARSDGVEVEATWQATHELNFIFNYGYNDTSILDSGCITDAFGDPSATGPGAQTSGCPAGTGTQNLKGNQLPNAPKNKIAGNINYTIDFGGGSLTFSATEIWRDKQFGTVFNRSYTEAPSWKQTDLRVQYKPAGDHLTVIVFGKNVFDEIGYPGGASATRETDATGTVVGYVKNYQLIPPRIVGAELQYKF